jgi:hypothetical protein
MATSRGRPRNTEECAPRMSYEARGLRAVRRQRPAFRARAWTENLSSNLLFFVCVVEFDTR